MSKSSQAKKSKAHRSRGERREASRKGLSNHLRVELLEPRILLSYTFALVGTTATVSPVAATGGPILIDEVLVAGNPLLEWSQDNGVTFSTDWDDTTPGTQTLPANTASVIDLTATTDAGSSITLGDLVSPASNIFPQVNLGASFGAANNDLIIDDRAEHPRGGNLRLLPCPGHHHRPRRSGGGDRLHVLRPDQLVPNLGGPAANTYNIHSTFNAVTTTNTIIGGAANDTVNVLGDTFPGIGTPLTIDMGGGANTVHVGNGNVGATVSAPVAVTDTGGTTSLILDDTGDTAHSTATLDNLSGNVGSRSK